LFNLNKNRKKNKNKKNDSTLFLPRKKKKYLGLIITFIVILLIVATLSVVKDNGSIKVTGVTIKNDQIPTSFDGYRILQISDLNGISFGRMQKRLIDKINSLEYDAIILTGDYLESSDSEDYWILLDILNGISKEKPVYYILGDKDYKASEIEQKDDNWNISIYPKEKTEFMQRIEEFGVMFVYPISQISIGDESIYLTGTDYNLEAFDAVNFDSDKCFSICVTHKPITYDVSSRLEDVNAVTLQEVDYDLSIAGHTLGGQQRLPFLGAFYVEGQGMFPQEQYTYGLRTDEDGRQNIITSGLGHTKGSFRLFNTPELILITLYAK